jgi:hypothetical protein
VAPRCGGGLEASLRSQATPELLESKQGKGLVKWECVTHHRQAHRTGLLKGETAMNDWLQFALGIGAILLGIAA